MPAHLKKMLWGATFILFAIEQISKGFQNIFLNEKKLKIGSNSNSNATIDIKKTLYDYDYNLESKSYSQKTFWKQMATWQWRRYAEIPHDTAVFQS